MSTEKLAFQNHSETEQNTTQYLDRANTLIDLADEIEMDDESAHSSLMEYTGFVMDAARNSEISGSQGVYDEKLLGGQLDDFASALEQAQLNNDPQMIESALKLIPRKDGLRDGFSAFVSNPRLAKHLPGSIRDWRSWETTYKEEQAQLNSGNVTYAVSSKSVTIEQPTIMPKTEVIVSEPVTIEQPLPRRKRHFGVDADFVVENIRDLGGDTKTYESYLGEYLDNVYDGASHEEIKYQGEYSYNEEDFDKIFDHLANQIDLFQETNNPSLVDEALNYVPEDGGLREGMRFILKDPRAAKAVSQSIRNRRKKSEEN